MYALSLLHHDIPIHTVCPRCQIHTTHRRPSLEDLGQWLQTVQGTRPQDEQTRQGDKLRHVQEQTGDRGRGLFRPAEAG